MYLDYCLRSIKINHKKLYMNTDNKIKGVIVELNEQLSSKTISDFGEQWVNYRDNPGYYGSVELLADLFGPLLPVDAVRGMRVADIGSGTGRIVNMLLDAEAAHVFAVEPSAAFSVLQTNTSTRSDRMTYVRGRGESLPSGLNLDLVVSMGVLHHIPEPDPVVDAAFRALRPGGHMLVWLYGREGNELYLRFANPMRAVTKRMPHMLLVALCSLINVVLDAYIFCCRFLPLPMRSYMRDVLARFPRSVRKLTIYDQLNPAYAKYYSKDEAESLLIRAGFSSVSAWHRHGYSWSVVGKKPPKMGSLKGSTQ
jgi:SAM-dependent methyltransferase